MFQLTPVVRGLLLANVAAFLIVSFVLGQPAYRVLALHYFGSSYHSSWQWFSHLFMHANFMHLFTNMLGLVVFGPLLERVWGPVRFLSFYLLCGVGASLLYTGVHHWEISQLSNLVDAYRANLDARDFSLLLKNIGMQERYATLLDNLYANPDSAIYVRSALALADQVVALKVNTPMVGASGAIFGVLMAFGLLFPNLELMLLFPPIPIRAKYLVAFYALAELYSGLNPSPGDNVAHYAHLGGMLFALVFVVLWKKNNRYTY